MNPIEGVDLGFGRHDGGVRAQHGWRGVVEFEVGCLHRQNPLSPTRPLAVKNDNGFVCCRRRREEPSEQTKNTNKNNNNKRREPREVGNGQTITEGVGRERDRGMDAGKTRQDERRRGGGIE